LATWQYENSLLISPKLSLKSLKESLSSPHLGLRSL
jgi:hypothetical protein